MKEKINNLKRTLDNSDSKEELIKVLNDADNLSKTIPTNSSIFEEYHYLDDLNSIIFGVAEKLTEIIKQSNIG